MNSLPVCMHIIPVKSLMSKYLYMFITLHLYPIYLIILNNLYKKHIEIKIHVIG